MGRRREPLSRVVLLPLLAVLSFGCKTEPAQPAPAANAPPALAADKSTPPSSKLPNPKLEWTAAGPGEVPALVVDAAAKAGAGGRNLIVYVGATWCEPCQKFHQAANKGELDRVLSDVSILEFDADRDKERLEKAGYTSTYIPLFVMPDAYGKATSRRVEGGIKGDAVVAYLARRIRAILVGQPLKDKPGAAP